MKNLIITLPACRDLEAISDYFLASSVEAGDSKEVVRSTLIWTTRFWAQYTESFLRSRKNGVICRKFLHIVTIESIIRKVSV